MNLDIYIFNLINGLAEKWKLLDLLGVFFAEYFEYFLLFYLIIFLTMYLIKSALADLSPEAKQFNWVNFKKYFKMVAEALLIAFFVRFILVEIIRILWFRSRPFVDNSVNLLLPYHNPHEASFPSGHASFYFALSTIIYGYDKKIGILFYVGSSFIAMARIFVGIHWPSDILAGAILGVVASLILVKVFRKIYF